MKNLKKNKIFHCIHKINIFEKSTKPWTSHILRCNRVVVGKYPPWFSCPKIKENILFNCRHFWGWKTTKNVRFSAYKVQKSLETLISSHTTVSPSGPRSYRERSRVLQPAPFEPINPSLREPPCRRDNNKGVTSTTWVDGSVPLSQCTAHQLGSISPFMLPCFSDLRINAKLT